MVKSDKIKTRVLVLFLMASVFGLTGCGGSSGGGGSNDTTASLNGIYTGTITGGETLPNIIGEKGIIYNGKLLVLSEESDGIRQLFEASLSATDNSTSGNGFRYDDTSLLNNVAYNGSFVKNQSASINFTKSGNASANLPDGTFNLMVSSALLARGSSINRIEGAWTGNFGSNFSRGMTLIFDVNGNIVSGSADDAPNDCAFTDGSITPADTLINIYNVSLTSDGGSGAFTCGLPAGNYSGLAWTEGNANGTLILMATNSILKRSRAVILTKN